jgi:hypothetical protein
MTQLHECAKRLCYDLPEHNAHTNSDKLAAKESRGEILDHNLRQRLHILLVGNRLPMDGLALAGSGETWYRHS